MLVDVDTFGFGVGFDPETNGLIDQEQDHGGDDAAPHESDEHALDLQNELIDIAFEKARLAALGKDVGLEL